MNTCNHTLDYYNQNASAFTESTFHTDMHVLQDHFSSLLYRGASILDFGCGSGRDAKFFLEQGFAVEAVDGSAECVKLARELTGLDVKQLLFQELDAVESYDGIWACASILHLPKGELGAVLQKMAAALKDNGVIYTSFKYGDFEGERNGRYFTDFTEEAFSQFIEENPKVAAALTIEEMWLTCDARPGRGDEKWLNIIMRRRSTR
ncbi:MAG: class I SAM-dependent methyltransferase [Lachnospiraceae bacterium]|nr:class I SAM-dependent methyltransferase [Lachnospiraceae bacterium]